jgi:proton-dependent oligopeptide transporter, POT family
MNVVLLVGIVINVLTAIPVVLQLRRHPRGLFVLFLTEMWERFSYYGMRALLIYYLTQHFLFADKDAAGQYGAYATLIYLMPLVGGILADRYLGTRKAVMFGAVLLSVGQLALAIQGPPARQTLTYQGHTYAFQVEGRASARHVRLQVGAGAYDFAADAAGGLRIEGLPVSAPLPAELPKGSYTLKVEPRPALYLNIFYGALSLIIIGVGYLKANIATIAGQLYPEGDPRRDSGFTLYYYGMNLGAFWAAIICGAVGQTVGWWAGFGLAGIGMVLGLVVFILGKPLLQGKGGPPDPARLKQAVAGPLKLEPSLYLLAAVGVVAAYLMLRNYAVVGVLLGLGSVAVLGYLGWYMARRCDRVARQRLGLALILLLGSSVFWALFELQGSAISLFTDRNVQLPSNGFWSITAPQTQSFNPGFILLFAPVFAWLWARLGRAGRDPSPTAKFGLALLQVGVAFLVLVWGARFADAQYREPLLILMISYLLQTTGEFCLSPIGLSEITKLAPAALVSTLMAVWYLSISWGEWIGGRITQLAGTATVGGQVLDPKAALETSLHVFNAIGWAAAAFGVAFLIATPWLKGWAHRSTALHTTPDPLIVTAEAG